MAGSLYPRTLHPLHAVFLAGIIPLFLGALLSDIAYARTYEIQWSNFASWLVVGGLAFGAVALLFALVGAVRARRGFYLLLLLATWVVGGINALVHARDAWGIMPTAPILSALAFVLACLATWSGFAGSRWGAAA